MPQTEVDLFRSVRTDQFPHGTVVDEKPAPEVLYPDFEPRVLPSGKRRQADVTLSEDKQWVKSGGGTSLFDRPEIFKAKGWSTLKAELSSCVSRRSRGHSTTWPETLW